MRRNSAGKSGQEESQRKNQEKKVKESQKEKVKAPLFLNIENRGRPAFSFSP
jgi:hypothetical protein